MLALPCALCGSAKWRGRCCCSFGGLHCTGNGQLRVACCAGGLVLALPCLCVEVFPAQIPGRIPSRIL